MQGPLRHLKPAAKQTTHLLSAALLWTIVGGGLLCRGSLWLVDQGKGWYILPAIAIGSLKSVLLLDRSAQKSIDRILHFDDNHCLGGVYSVQTWALVVFMMLCGVVLRKSSLSPVLIGGLYTSVGWSLILSSRLGWRAWKRKHGAAYGENG
ncbi:MAG: hypothetical protein ABR512_07430 [Desulfopila sp.]